MSRAYLDHASTSPLRPAARAAMVDWLDHADPDDLVAGDPGRLHSEAMRSRVGVEEARERVASFFGARPREVVFTSGATESIATASWGAARIGGGHSAVSAVEHSAVREWAERGPCTTVGVDPAGQIDPDELVAAVSAETSLVHCQLVNHEVGTIQPVAPVRERLAGRTPLLHVDAAQAAGRIPIDFVASGVDLMSISGHKMGGPTGIGVLLVRRGLRIEPLLVGGDQERARRAGMENVAAIVGLAAACDECDIAAEAASQRRLASRIVSWADSSGRVAVLGATAPDDRAPHLVCLGIEGIEPQPVLIGLDAAGVAVHSGSSCSSESVDPSPVLAAMGVDADRSLRISLGWSSTDADVDRLLDALPRVLDGLAALDTR